MKISAILIIAITLTVFGCSSSENTQKNAFDGQTAANGNANASDPVRQKHDERAANMRNADKNDGTQIQSTAQPGPENSEITVSLGEVATETRTFKGHAQLDKVVKTTEGKNSSVKVYLKNGKTVDLPGEKIPNIRTIPVASILEAAGGAPMPEQKALPNKGAESEEK